MRSILHAGKHDVLLSTIYFPRHRQSPVPRDRPLLKIPILSQSTINLGPQGVLPLRAGIYYSPPTAAGRRYITTLFLGHTNIYSPPSRGRELLHRRAVSREVYSLPNRSNPAGLPTYSGLTSTRHITPHLPQVFWRKWASKELN